MARVLDDVQTEESEDIIMFLRHNTWLQLKIVQKLQILKFNKNKSYDISPKSTYVWSDNSKGESLKSLYWSKSTNMHVTFTRERELRCISRYITFYNG